MCRQATIPPPPEGKHGDSVGRPVACTHARIHRNRRFLRGRRPARRNSAPKIVLQISLARQAASADDFCAKDNLTARKMQYRLTREMIGSLYLLMRCAPV